MKKNIKKATYLLLFLLAAAAVYFLYPNKNKEEILQISPLAGADIPYREYSFCNDTSFSVVTETGTRVSIPADILETAEDKIGPCSLVLKIREFHDAWALFRAGIPMQISGTNNYLQSAGMIDIQITQKGKSVTIQANKQIEVELAGYRSSEGYDLYYLDGGSNWIKKDTFVIDTNLRKNIQLNKVRQLPEKPEDTLSSTGDLIFEIVADLKQVPYLEPFKGLSWKVSQKDQRPELFKALRMQWDKVSVNEVNRRRMEYELVFAKSMQVDSGPDIKRTFSVKASPVFSGWRKSKARKTFSEQLAVYEEALRKLKEEEKRLEAEADLLNKFKIDKLGIWNIDRICSESNMFYVDASFDFENEMKDKIPSMKLYAVYEDLNSVIPYTKKEWKKVGLHTSGKMSLVAVLNAGTLAIVEYPAIQAVVNKEEKTAFFRSKKRQVPFFN